MFYYTSPAPPELISFSGTLVTNKTSIFTKILVGDYFRVRYDDSGTKIVALYTDLIDGEYVEVAELSGAIMTQYSSPVNMNINTTDVIGLIHVSRAHFSEEFNEKLKNFIENLQLQYTFSAGKDTSGSNQTVVLLPTYSHFDADEYTDVYLLKATKNNSGSFSTTSTGILKTVSVNYTAKILFPTFDITEPSPQFFYGLTNSLNDSRTQTYYSDVSNEIIIGVMQDEPVSDNELVIHISGDISLIPKNSEVYTKGYNTNNYNEELDISTGSITLDNDFSFTYKTHEDSTFGFLGGAYVAVFSPNKPLIKYEGTVADLFYI